MNTKNVTLEFMCLQASNYSNNSGKIKGLMICSVGRRGAVLLTVIYWWLLKKHVLLSYISEEGERHVFKWRQVNHILPDCVFPSAMRWTGSVSVSLNKATVTKNSTDRRERVAWFGKDDMLPDSGQVAPLSCHCDHIKAHSPASLPDLLCVKTFNSHSWWH